MEHLSLQKRPCILPSYLGAKQMGVDSENGIVYIISLPSPKLRRFQCQLSIETALLRRVSLLVFLLQRHEIGVVGAAEPQGPREENCDYLLKTECSSLQSSHSRF
ncbi:hypothetical protein TNCV_1801291 [Trichonephila clavipes]|nr:hypothetical protein TNCV_1801291 [Trichonephila clavipes]